MARTRKTDRTDEEFLNELDSQAEEKRETRDTFENHMFADEIANPFHIPRSDWPEGKSLRWISLEVTGQPDRKNWTVKTTAGWTPVQRDKHPKLDARFPYIPMPGEGANSDQSIMFGGLCLCERDIRYLVRDAKIQAKATADSLRTVEQWTEGSSSSVPRFNQSSGVTYERGNAAFKE